MQANVQPSFFAPSSPPASSTSLDAAAVPRAVSPASSTLPRLDLRYLDGLRALAAVLVVLHHSWEAIWQTGDTAPAWTQWLAPGHTVPVFMVLSGFCLMLPVVRGDGSLRGGATGFIRKRADRILPPYFFAIAFSLLLDIFLIGHKTGGFWDVTLPLTWQGLALHLLLLQNFSLSQAHTINYVFWSLSLEWWIYFLFPGLVWGWKRFGAGTTAVGAVIAAYTLWHLCGSWLHNGFTLNYVGLFVLGMLAAEIVYTRRTALRTLSDRLPWTWITGIVTVLCLLSMTGKIRHFSSGDLVEFLVAFWTMCLLVTLSLRQNTFLGRVLSFKPLAFCGTFAYSIYLIHAPVIQVIWEYTLCPARVTHSTAFVLLGVFGIPAVLACAYAFHLAFERPFMTQSAPKASQWPQSVRIQYS